MLDAMEVITKTSKHKTARKIKKETLSIDQRPARMSAEETLELVASIPALKQIFNRSALRGDLKLSSEERRLQKEQEEIDTTDGILYCSRFNKPTKPVVSDIFRQEDKEEDMSNELKETKQEEDTTVSGRNRGEKRRFATSLATLAAKIERRIDLVKDGAIPVLISMSYLSDVTIERSCASAFASLSMERSIRAQMIEEGSFAAIVSLMGNSNSNHSLVGDCCVALGNLCCESGYESRAVKEGVPFALIHAIGTYPQIVKSCLQILLNLTCVPDKYSRLEEVTEALMHFNGYSLTAENEILVISSICNLSALRNFQLRLVEDGCLRFVDRVMKSQIGELRRLASAVLQNLTTEAKTRIKLVDNSIITTLVLMSKDELESVRLHCVHAFFNLARDALCREKIVNANAVSVIIKMSMEKFESMELGRMAARILRILCGDARIAHKLVLHGIIKALMSLLRTDDGVIQQYCAESICSLFQIGDVMGRLVDQGAVGILVSLSQNNTDFVTGEWCSFALYHLATNKVCPAAMLEHGILPCIIRLCEGSSERTKYFCAAALEHITQNKSVDASGSIAILVHMLRNVKDLSTKSNCAASLYNLADNDENCFMMLQNGALLPVVELTQSDHMHTKMKCAAILSRLSLHKDYYSQFATGDVLRVLLDLSCVDHIFTQRKVIIALSNLSQSQELRAQLLALNPIPYIISLASKCDENLRRGCASIVCNLSYEVGSEKAIVKAGIVPTLFITAMVTSDQIVSKIICAKALINLMADRSLYEDMVKGGVIWGMSSLALLGNSELLTLCSTALCSLSCDYPRQMLGVRAAVKTVMMAITQTEDLELLKSGARTLTNILLQTTDADVAFRRQAAENMTALAESDDTEVSEMCILCLCLASQSESCRETIVCSGMLQKIDASTIFTKPQISYAYLTMFGNIANNPSMRTMLLDDKSISRFQQICMSCDPHLDMAVAKAIYCISCAAENIPKLVDQNVLVVIQKILNAEYAKSSELIHHLLACMYNLTTFEDVQFKLVAQGIVRVIAEMWDSFSQSPKMCELAFTAVCHLACGSVNTDRMVRDGGGIILCKLAEAKAQSKTAKSDNVDLVDRCAAGMRNLLSILSNQAMMVEAGCLEALRRMANTSLAFIKEEQNEATQNSIGIKAAGFQQSNPGGCPSSRRQKSAKPPVSEISFKHQRIFKNCASAMRSMTYNTEIQEQLAEEGTIDIILGDMASGSAHPHGELNIGHSLLCDLETESWKNGSRGPQKEGRAPPIPPLPLSESLLRDIDNVQLDVDRRTVVLEKYHVQVQVEDPKIDIEASLTKVELSIHDLASYGDNDDADGPSVMSCPKQESLSYIDSMPSPGKGLPMYEDGEDEVEDFPSSSLAAAESSVLEGLKDSSSSSSRPGAAAASAVAGGAGGVLALAEGGAAAKASGATLLGASSTTELRSDQLPELLKQGHKSPPNPVTGSDSRPGSRPGSMKKSSSSSNLPKIVTVPKRKPKREDEEMRQLIRYIKASKNFSDGSSINLVMDKWHAMSKK